MFTAQIPACCIVMTERINLEKQFEIKLVSSTKRTQSSFHYFLLMNWIVIDPLKDNWSALWSDAIKDLHFQAKPHWSAFSWLVSPYQPCDPSSFSFSLLTLWGFSTQSFSYTSFKTPIIVLNQEITEVVGSAWGYSQLWIKSQEKTWKIKQKYNS